MIYFGNATAIMFATIILGSVAITTIYGAFRGSKLCLVPFVFLQVVFLYLRFRSSRFVLIRSISNGTRRITGKCCSCG
ncbi:hypothetical protein OSTOST_19565 [Ostertagia ostertagi]